ncbi:MAG: polymorphic toxin-type HINT domain-containing protein [Pirellulales bacterium]
MTGRFNHPSANNLVNLRLANQSETTGVTSNHPYWSADRQAFVEVGDLQPGETVNTLLGPTTVVSITPRIANQKVYNLEVHNEHVYRVGTASVAFGRLPERFQRRR